MTKEGERGKDKEGERGRKGTRWKEKVKTEKEGSRGGDLLGICVPDCMLEVHLHSL